MVYGSCSSLSGFDSTTYKDCDLLYLDAGSTIGISEMMHDGKPVSEMELKASQIDYIKAEDMENFTPVEPHESNDMAELIRLIFLILGGACMAYGLGRGNPLAAVIGLILIAFGLIASGPLAELLSNPLIGWTFRWPR